MNVMANMIGEDLMRTKGKAWIRQEFEARLRSKGTVYHDHHPFNLRLQAGECSRDQIRGWVANQFYYQLSLPRKDAAILSNCPQLETRRRWLRRIADQDGEVERPGRIHAWERLADAVGLPRAELWSLDRVVPGVRFAVDAYLNFVRRAPWQEGVCASLPELFELQAAQTRKTAWTDRYSWIDVDATKDFKTGMNFVNDDLEHSLEVTLDYFKRREEQENALDILQVQLDILWNVLDSIDKAFPGDVLRMASAKLVLENR
jgi:pyrroloquinoline-quinone synthase